ncbi:MAG: hypothetical protein ACON4T_00440 [Synechococcus sp.]
MGITALSQAVCAWFPLVGKERTTALKKGCHVKNQHNTLMSYPHINLLKGLAWCAGLQENAEIAVALHILAINCSRRKTCFNALTKAATWALGAMPGSVGIDQLHMPYEKIVMF